ncbi:MAG: GNAT family N-acetyltransferase [Anaerolineales bacterium]|nr:MAG: GNAT family N-acetyltransferase [Anaerolineales bacterium]
MDIKIRMVTPDDAKGVLEVLNSVVREQKYSSLDRILTVEEERQFIASLGERSGFFVAELDGHIVGFQTIEPFATYTSAMDHVGIMGTFVHADFRGQGIGRQLAEASFKFAWEKGYEKAVIYVRASNRAAQKFYWELGFVPKGTLEKQVRIGEEYDDEVFMEMFLEVEEEEVEEEEEVKTSKEVIVRRAKRRDIPAITVIMNGLLGKGTFTADDVMQKIFEKAYWVAVGEKAGGLAGWQAENLVTCIDEFYVYPPGHWEGIGGPLLETIEAEAYNLSCEVSIVFVDKYHPQGAVEFFASRGYERQQLEDLIKIWREVASEFMTEDRFLMLRKLREKRIMQPL